MSESGWFCWCGAPKPDPTPGRSCAVDGCGYRITTTIRDAARTVTPMRDGEVDRDVLRPAAVPRSRLSAGARSLAGLAGQIITGRMLDGDLGRRTTVNVTCPCGTLVTEDTREPVGPVTARGEACTHTRAGKGAFRPTEAKRHPAVETK